MSAELGCASGQASGQDQFPKTKAHRAKSTCKTFETEPHPGGLPSEPGSRHYRSALPHPVGEELGTEPSAFGAFHRTLHQLNYILSLVIFSLIKNLGN